MCVDEIIFIMGGGEDKLLTMIIDMYNIKVIKK